MDTLEEKEATPIKALDDDALYCVLVATLPARWRVVAARVCRRWRRCVTSEPLAMRGWLPIELASIKERMIRARGSGRGVARSYPLSLEGTLLERNKRRGRRLFFEALTTGNLRVLDWIEADARGPLWLSDSTSPLDSLSYGGEFGTGPWALRPRRGGSLACEAAAGSGQMASLRWLRERPEPCPWGPRALYRALAIGRLDIAGWIDGSSGGDSDDPSPCNVWYASTAIRKAIRSGDPAVVEWVCQRERAADVEWCDDHFDSFEEHRSRVEALPCAYATEIGYDHLITVLEAHGYPFCPGYCAEAAAHAGRLDALRSILADHPITANDTNGAIADDGGGTWSDRDKKSDPITAEGLVSKAIRGGHIPLIEWAYSTFAETTEPGGTQRAWDPNIVPYMAASDDRIHVLDWLRKHPDACRWEPGVLRRAVLEGDMRVARWLRETLDPPCPWTIDLSFPWTASHSLGDQWTIFEDNAEAVAATIGWAIDAGCPWDPAACATEAATQGGDNLGHVLDIVVSRAPSCVDDEGATALAAVNTDCPPGAYDPDIDPCPPEWRANCMWRAIGRGFPWHPNVCAVLDAGGCHAEAVRAIAAGCPCPDPALLIRIARSVALLLDDYDDGDDDDDGTESRALDDADDGLDDSDDGSDNGNSGDDEPGNVEASSVRRHAVAPSVG